MLERYAENTKKKWREQVDRAIKDRNTSCIDQVRNEIKAYRARRDSEYGLQNQRIGLRKPYFNFGDLKKSLREGDRVEDKFGRTWIKDKKGRIVLAPFSQRAARQANKRIKSYLQINWDEDIMIGGRISGTDKRQAEVAITSSNVSETRETINHSRKNDLLFIDSRDLAYGLRITGMVLLAFSSAILNNSFDMLEQSTPYVPKS